MQVQLLVQQRSLYNLHEALKCNVRMNANVDALIAAVHQQNVAALIAAVHHQQILLREKNCWTANLRLMFLCSGHTRTCRCPACNEDSSAL